MGDNTKLKRKNNSFSKELSLKYKKSDGTYEEFRYELCLNRKNQVTLKKKIMSNKNQDDSILAVYNQQIYKFQSIDKKLIKECIFDGVTATQKEDINLNEKIDNYISNKIERKKRNNYFFGTIIILSIIILLDIIGYNYYNNYRLNRKNISSKYKWNVNDIYKDYSEWEKDYNNLKNQIINAKVATNSPEELYKTLQKKEEIQCSFGKLFIYEKLLNNINLKDNKPIKKIALLNSLALEIDTKFNQVDYMISNMSNEDVEKYLNDTNLSKYSSYIKNIRNSRTHYLSLSEENIISQLSIDDNIPNNIFNQLYQLNKKENDNIYYKNSMAYNLQCKIQKNVSLSKVKKYNSFLEKALSGENLTSNVYTDMITSINTKFPYKDYKYFINNKNFTIHSNSKYIKISYEEGKDILLEALRPLGERYISDVQDALNNNWIDVYPTYGKNISSQYTSPYYNGHPYISINYDNSVESLLSLAHELGHAMNFYYSSKSKENTYYDYSPSILLSEAVAQTNEKLVMRHLLDKYSKDGKEKLGLLTTYQNNLTNSIYIQTLYSEFEKNLYDKVEKGEGLSIDFLDARWIELQQKYNISIGNGWCEISHFYNGFYVYKYVISNCIAEIFVKNLTEKNINGNNEQYRSRYINFISSGSKKNTVDLLKEMDIDINDPSIYNNSIETFEKNFGEIKEILR